MKTVSLSDHVWVRLTPAGVHAYGHYYLSHEPNHNGEQAPTVGEWSKFTLSELIQKFGPYFSNWYGPILQDGVIALKDPDTTSEATTEAPDMQCLYGLPPGTSRG